MPSSWSNPQEYEEFLDSIPVGWKNRIKDRVSVWDFYTHPRSGDSHWVEFYPADSDNPTPRLAYCSSCGVDGSTVRDYSPL